MSNLRQKFGILVLVRSAALDPILPPTPGNTEGNMKNIFVGNLAFSVTENTVRSLFEAHGAVDRVSLVTDRDTGQARGFGFVEMPVNAEAERAIAALNGMEVEGRALNVNEARPKTERGFGGGGGNRGGGGGGPRRNNRW